MNGEKDSLYEFLEGSKNKFIIPVYQRNYDWKKDNCDQLLSDLVNLKEKPSHFFGSIVCSHFKKDRYYIIDGQQRITTITLLSLALYNLLRENKIEADKDNLINEIEEQVLKSKFLREEDNLLDLKLKLNKKDMIAYKKLYENHEDYIENSNITINYKYFYNRILNEHISPDALYEAIQKLEIINIELEKDDDPQLIFESLNSTGLDLSEADKIKNLVLMGIKDIEQQKLYFERYWDKIENNTIIDNISYTSDFIRDYLSMKNKKTPNKTNVYFDFKVFFKKINNLEDFLGELTSYSKTYKNLLCGEGYTDIINESIKRLNNLGTSVIRPFLLEIFTLNDKDILSIKDIEKIFITIESYIFRRWVCDIPTNALNKIFTVLGRDIYKLEDNYKDYYNKFLYILESKNGSGVFPNDGSFISHIKDEDFYNISSKNREYTLERLENFDSLEKTDVENFTCEHIMPQHLTNKWKEALGENAIEIHKVWLHRLANLTFTAYNSKYSDNDFITKRDMEKGFKDSGIKLNNYLQQLNKWDEEELIKRADFLAEKALKIWPKDETTYIKEEANVTVYSLADDHDFTGEDIKAFSFYDNQKQETKGWTDMMLNVIRILYFEDSSILLNLACDTENKLGLYCNDMSVKKDKILDNLYIKTTNDTKTKIKILKTLFALYNIDCEQLEFYL